MDLITWKFITYLFATIKMHWFHDQWTFKALRRRTQKFTPIKKSSTNVFFRLDAIIIRCTDIGKLCTWIVENNNLIDAKKICDTDSNLQPHSQHINSTQQYSWSLQGGVAACTVLSSLNEIIDFLSLRCFNTKRIKCIFFVASTCLQKQYL